MTVKGSRSSVAVPSLLLREDHDQLLSHPFIGMVSHMHTYQRSQVAQESYRFNLFCFPSC